MNTCRRGGARDVSDALCTRSAVLCGTNARCDLVGLYIEANGATHGFLLTGREQIRPAARTGYAAVIPRVG